MWLRPRLCCALTVTLAVALVLEAALPCDGIRAGRKGKKKGGSAVTPAAAPPDLPIPDCVPLVSSGTFSATSPTFAHAGDSVWWVGPSLTLLCYQYCYYACATKYLITVQCMLN